MTSSSGGRGPVRGLDRKDCKAATRPHTCCPDSLLPVPVQPQLLPALKQLSERSQAGEHREVSDGQVPPEPSKHPQREALQHLLWTQGLRGGGCVTAKILSPCCSTHALQWGPYMSDAQDPRPTVGEAGSHVHVTRE